VNDTRDNTQVTSVVYTVSLACQMTRPNQQTYQRYLAQNRSCSTTATQKYPMDGHVTGVWMLVLTCERAAIQTQWLPSQLLFITCNGFTRPHKCLRLNYIENSNKTGNVRITEHRGAFEDRCWKSNKYYILCMCACARARGCVHASVCM
jgi:hypothetical protein